MKGEGDLYRISLYDAVRDQKYARSKGKEKKC